LKSLRPLSWKTLPDSTHGRQLFALQFLLAGANLKIRRNPRGFGGILKHLRGKSQAAIPEEAGRGSGKDVLVNRREVVY
jgi:hypothetical protein